MNSFKFKLSVLLILIGVAGRFLLVEYVNVPNFEIITSISLVSGIFLGGKYAVFVPLVTIFLSDVIIGNRAILLFTWSAFAIIGVMGACPKNKKCKKSLSYSVYLASVASLFFFLYTNLGWWLLSGMYEYSFNGLVKCYIAALPFFRNNLLGNLIFVPSFIKIMTIFESRYPEIANLNKYRIKITDSI